MSSENAFLNTIKTFLFWYLWKLYQIFSSIIEINAVLKEMYELKKIIQRCFIVQIAIAMAIVFFIFY